jgi:hypothetical protein
LAQVPFFLKQKPQTGVMTEHRSENTDSQDNYGLEAAASELIQAIEAKDTKAVARALQSAFMLLDSNDEGEPNE